MDMISKEHKKEKLGFEETELRLGLPGGGGIFNEDLVKNTNANGKRWYTETVDLKLNFALKETEKGENLQKEKSLISCSNDSVKPPPK